MMHTGTVPYRMSFFVPHRQHKSPAMLHVVYRRGSRLYVSFARLLGTADNRVPSSWFSWVHSSMPEEPDQLERVNK